MEALGKRAKVQFLFDRPNQMGAWELGGLPGLLPGWRRVGDAAARARLEEAWGTSLPADSGADFRRMLVRSEAGGLDLLYVAGGDPLLSYPDGDLVESALIKTGLLVSAAIVLIAACSDGDDGTAGSETLPVIGDAGSIWCDEQRWQVVVRASQLGLSTPPTNPAEEVWSAEFQQRGDQLDVDVQLGRIVPGSKLQALEDMVVEANAVAARYESGEWDTSGVLDDDWATWRNDEAAAYARACAAAYELAGGPSAPLGASSNLSSQPGAAAETTAPAVPTPTPTPTTQVPATDASVTSTTTATPPSTVSTSTTARPAPAELVAGPVVACPDFIEATFENHSASAASVVELALFIEGAIEPFGYITDWTPTILGGSSATWRVTAADMGLNEIGPGPVFVGAATAVSPYSYVYAEGDNPHSSCSS